MAGRQDCERQVTRLLVEDCNAISVVLLQQVCAAAYEL